MGVTMNEVLHITTFRIAFAQNAGPKIRPMGFQLRCDSSTANLDGPKYRWTSARFDTTDSKEPDKTGARMVLVADLML